MKKLLSLFLIIVLLFTLVACEKETAIVVLDPIDASDEVSTCSGIDFNATLESINKSHQELISNADFDGIDDYLVVDIDDYNQFSKAEAQAIANLHNGKHDNTVTHSQMIADTNTIYNLYQSAYACYYYFGVENFQNAKAEMLKWIDAQPEQTDYFDFADRLADAFSFLRDGHAYVVRHQNQHYYSYYYCNGQEFGLDETGYYKDFEDGRYYITELSDSNARIEKTLTDDGRIVYSPILFVQGNEPERCKIVMQNATGQIKYQLFDWIQSSPLRHFNSGIVELDELEKDGVAYIALRSFQDKNKDNKKILNNFVETANKYKDAKAVIIDIRCNNGGTYTYSNEWLETFFGDCPTAPVVEATRNSTFLNALNKFSGKPTEEKWTKTIIPAHWVENKTPIIVLVDNQCISAGEIFLKNLKAAENVIVVGSNTAGGQIGLSPTNDLMLPKSKLNFCLATKISFTYDLSNRDQIGFEPDIWCNPKTSLDAVMNMLELNDYINADYIDTMHSTFVDANSENISLKVIGLATVTAGQGIGTGGGYLPIEVLYKGEKVTDYEVKFDKEGLVKLEKLSNGELRIHKIADCKVLFYVTVNGETSWFWWQGGI